MADLRTARLPELAVQYSTLSERLISCETDYICQSTANLPDFTAAAAYQSMSHAQLPLCPSMNTTPADWVPDISMWLAESTDQVTTVCLDRGVNLYDACRRAAFKKGKLSPKIIH